jgi:hypothetical protein
MVTTVECSGLYDMVRMSNITILMKTHGLDAGLLTNTALLSMLAPRLCYIWFLSRVLNFRIYNQ